MMTREQAIALAKTGWSRSYWDGPSTRMELYRVPKPAPKEATDEG